MKKNVLFIVVLMAALLAIAGSTTAAAKSDGKITGGVHFTAPDFGIEGWMRFNIHAAGPGGAATGWLRWKEYSELEGWRRVVASPTCVLFGEFDGEPTAIFVVEIVSRTGWGEGDPGQYLRVWALDGGTPGRKGDGFATLTWPPQDEPLLCVWEDPAFRPFVIDGGNLMIHN